MRPVLAFVHAAALTGCVSTQTMSSTTVKANVIAQTYSVHCSSPAEACALVAQFRVGDHRGQTLELRPPSAVRMGGKAPRFNDTRVANEVLDVFSLITFVPMFKLLK